MSDSPNKPRIGFTLTFFDPNESNCAIYQKIFRNDENVDIKNISIQETKGYDCLIVPMNSAFGIKSSTGFVHDILTYVKIFVNIFLKLSN